MNVALVSQATAKMVNHPNRSRRAKMFGKDVSCIDGRAMRHDPQHDDPYLQTDIGPCEECGGKGCPEPAKCERCEAEDISPVIEAFELSGQVVCEDCAQEVFDENSQFGVGA